MLTFANLRIAFVSSSTVSPGHTRQGMNGRVVPVSPVTEHSQYRHQPPLPGLCPTHSTLSSSQQAEAHIQSKYQWLAEVDITRPRPVLLMSERERSGDQQKEVVNVGCPPRWPASSSAPPNHVIQTVLSRGDAAFNQCCWGPGTWACVPLIQYQRVKF